VKVLPSGEPNPLLQQNKLIGYQSNTSRSGGKVLTCKKVKSPVLQHMQKGLEQTPINQSYSNKKYRMQNMEVKDLSQEMVSPHLHNYKTSRMPLISSLAFNDLHFPSDQLFNQNTAENEQMLHQHLINCENLIADNSSP